MESIKIVLLCVLASVAYGLVMDQVTVRICVEYFSIAHPHIFDTDSPTLLALGWGVIATWWVGLILGLLVALAARVGGEPRFTAAQCVKPIGLLLAIMALATTVAGIVGWLQGGAGGFVVVEPFASQIPSEHHARFLADLWAHSAAYAVGILGGLVLCVWIARRRFIAP